VGNLDVPQLTTSATSGWVAEKPADIVAVGSAAGAAAFGLEIPLVPEAQFLLGACGAGGGRDARDHVASDRDQGAHPLRSQRGDDAGRAHP
jgi:hypothetical protein